MRAEVDIPSATALSLEEVGCASPSVSGEALMTGLLAVFLEQTRNVFVRPFAGTQVGTLSEKVAIFWTLAAT